MTAPSSSPAAAPVQRFSIASDASDSGYDSANSTFRDFQLNRFPRPVDLASADEFTDAVPDRFANQFDATPSRKSVSSAEDPGHQSSTDEESERELQELTRGTGDMLTHVTERVSSIVHDQIVPAAQQVVKSGAPVAIKLGKLTFQLSVHMAQELLQSPVVTGALLYGYMLDNKMAPESWSQWSYRVLVTGEPPPEFSQYEQWLKLLQNMSTWGLWAAKKHISTTWTIKLSKMILKSIEEQDRLAPGAIQNIAKAGFKALHGLYNMYQWVNTPMNSVLALASHHKDSDDEPLVKKRDSDTEPLVKKRPTKKKPPYDSDNEPLIKKQPTKKKPPLDSDNEPLVKPRPKNKSSSSTGRGEPMVSIEGRGQQALKQQAPLVNYGTGVRQIRRGGGKTINTMAPILEFNETADDPYVMRQQVH